MNKQQIKGTTNEVTGKIKKEVGKMTGDRTTEARGKATEVKGKLQQGVGNAKEELQEDPTTKRRSGDRWPSASATKRAGVAGSFFWPVAIPARAPSREWLWLDAGSYSLTLEDGLPVAWPTEPPLSPELLVGELLLLELLLVGPLLVEMLLPVELFRVELPLLPIELVLPLELPEPELPLALPTDVDPDPLLYVLAAGLGPYSRRVLVLVDPAPAELPPSWLSRGTITLAAPSRESVTVEPPSRVPAPDGAPMAEAPGVVYVVDGATRAVAAGARTTSAGSEGAGMRAVPSGER
jgi:uncharacterized protein YjbJ (UPF0337 family)